jgi:MFS family permease
VDPEKSEQPAETAEELPPRDITGWKWAVVVLSILSSTFLFALDNTIVADIQPVIVLHFNDVKNLTWLSVAFLIGAAATNLIWGKIFGQFNSKWTYILCVLLFELGSAICGAAPSMDALIIGRAICGVAGSGMYVGVMTLLATTTTIHERPMYIGGTGLTWGLGTVLGPVIGGGFSDSPEGWRWAFYINLYPSRSVGCPSPARRPPGGRPVPSAKPKQARNSCLLTHQHHNLASSTTLLPALQSDHEASRRNARIL